MEGTKRRRNLERQSSRRPLSSAMRVGMESCYGDVDRTYADRKQLPNDLRQFYSSRDSHSYPDLKSVNVSQEFGKNAGGKWGDERGQRGIPDYVVDNAVRKRYLAAWILLLLGLLIFFWWMWRKDPSKKVKTVDTRKRSSHKQDKRAGEESTNPLRSFPSAPSSHPSSSPWSERNSVHQRSFLSTLDALLGN